MPSRNPICILHPDRTATIGSLVGESTGPGIHIEAQSTENASLTAD